MSDTVCPASGMDAAHWLALHRIQGLGPVAFSTLAALAGSPADLLGRPPAALRAAGVPPALAERLSAPDWAGVERDLAWVERANATLLTRDDPLYPEQLLATDAAPLLLFVRGDPALLGSPQLAIVGSRNPSAGGEATAGDLAAAVAAAGLVVTSGMALGIDAVAHRAALASGNPSIAVIGTGPDKVYPARHARLAEELAAHGAVVSEFVPGTGPERGNFPRRNRVISGLAVGTLVIEAGLRSGSLITARLAAEQGREVFAVPGSIHNPLARGCHRLIRDGARLVETIADILEELGGFLPGPVAAPVAGAAPARGARGAEPKLLQHMGHDPVTTDMLVRRSGLTTETVSSMLLALELQGLVEALAGGRYQRRVVQRELS